MQPGRSWGLASYATTYLERLEERAATRIEIELADLPPLSNVEVSNRREGGRHTISVERSQEAWIDHLSMIGGVAILWKIHGPRQAAQQRFQGGSYGCSGHEFREGPLTREYSRLTGANLSYESLADHVSRLYTSLMSLMWTLPLQLSLEHALIKINRSCAAARSLQRSFAGDQSTVDHAYELDKLVGILPSRYISCVLTAAQAYKEALCRMNGVDVQERSRDGRVLGRQATEMTRAVLDCTRQGPSRVRSIRREWLRSLDLEGLLPVV